MTETANAPRGDSTTRIVLTGLFLLAVMTTTELAFRVFTPFWDRLAEPRALKIAQYKAFLKSGRKVDYVFIGSSTTFMGIDPTIVDSVTGGTSFNAGQLGYTPINLNIAVAREIIEAGVAKEIVYSLDSWVANFPNGDRQSIDKHGRSDHFLWMSSVFRNRSVFAFWIVQLTRGKFIHPGEAWQHHLKASQRFASYDGVKLHENGYLETFGTMNANWPEYIRPKPIDIVTESEILKIVEMVTNSNIKLTIIRPPEYIITYEQNKFSHEKLSEFIDKIKHIKNLNIIDYSKNSIINQRKQDLFFDIHHVNSDGAKIISKDIGVKLKEKY